jgi:hypothetical protein
MQHSGVCPLEMTAIYNSFQVSYTRASGTAKKLISAESGRIKFLWRIWVEN